MSAMFVELNLDANDENEIQLLQYKNAGVHITKYQIRIEF